jgi:hypothetical protein
MSESPVAGVTVSVDALKRAVDHVTDVAVPLGVRVGVQGDIAEISFHDPEHGWWATTRCRGSAFEGTRGSAAVTVPQSWPEIPAPPSWIDLPCVDAQVALPRDGWDAEGTAVLAGDGHRVLVGGSLLARFVGREIDRVSLYRSGDDALLVGVTGEADPDERVVLIIPAQIASWPAGFSAAARPLRSRSGRLRRRHRRYRGVASCPASRPGLVRVRRRRTTRRDQRGRARSRRLCSAR